jgi:hypothetical protein
LIEYDVDNENGMFYKDYMQLIILQLEACNFPEKHRNSQLEERYFRADLDIDALYAKEGRMFRHLMGLCLLLGILESKVINGKKIINFEACKELTLSTKDVLMPVMRNNLLGININSNDLIKSLHGINVHEDADYKPVLCILKYMKEINRQATMFEISVLLGRIDDVQTERAILDRAVKIGKILPENQDDQIKFFFGSMLWKNRDGILYQYAPSQEPHFKFKTCFLFMQTFGLLTINVSRSTVSLTDYASKILADEIPIELLDLQDLLFKIDDDTEDGNMLYDVIIRKRSPSIHKAILTDAMLVQKLNFRSLRTVEYDRSGKRKRNKMISEIAKIKADFTCEATGRKTFRTPSGNYYVESHHIIEFGAEEGPDITENLIALGPEKHRLIHSACQEEIDDLYNHLKTNGVITIDRFKKMYTVYNCLTERHIQKLFDKKLISSIDRDELLNLIS